MKTAKQNADQGKFRQSPTGKGQKTAPTSTKNGKIQFKDKKGSPRINVKQIVQDNHGLNGGQMSPVKLMNSMTPRLQYVKKLMNATPSAVTGMSLNFNGQKMQLLDSELNQNSATALSSSQRPSFSMGKNQIGQFGRYEESELGLPHFAGSLMEVESRSKSPRQLPPHLEDFNNDTIKASHLTRHRQTTPNLFLFEDVTIQKSSTANTPRLAKKQEASIHHQVTDGEENISEEDDEIESSKHEAKLMAARINDTMQSNQDPVTARNDINNINISNHSTRMSPSKQLAQYSPRNEIRREHQSPNMARSQSPKINQIETTNTQQRYQILQQKWELYMKTELNRIQKAMADRSMSPLKRATDKYRQIYGLKSSPIPQNRFQPIKSGNPILNLVAASSPRQINQILKRQAKTPTRVARKNLKLNDGSQVHLDNSNILGYHRSNTPNIGGLKSIEKEETTANEQNAKQKKLNEWEERYASGLIDNYAKAMKVPFGTVDCENDPESKNQNSLSWKRVASNKREEFWRDNHATNIKTFSGFKMIDMEEREKEVHHKLRHHFSDRKFSSKVKIEYADEKQEVEPYKSRYNTGAEFEAMKVHRFTNLFNTKVFPPF